MPPDPLRSAPARYGVAVLAVALAAAVRLALDPVLGNGFPFTVLLLAVLATARLAGFGPAVVATLLGAGVAARFLLPPRDSFAVHGPDNQAGLCLYLLVGLGVAWLGGGLRAARDRAAAAAAAATRDRDELRATLASIGDAVAVTDADGRVASLNPVAEGLTGWAAADAAGRPLAEVFRIVNEHTRRPVENPAERALREGRIVGLANHTLLIARDGTERPIEDSAAPVRDAAGAVVGVVLVFRDVTDQKRAEAALRATADRLGLALAAGGLGDWSWDAATDLVTLSEPAAAVFGLPPGPHLTWTAMQELLHPDDRDRAGRAVEAAVAGRTQYDAEYRVDRPDGTRVWVAARGRGHYADDGRPLGMFGVVQDVTARKAADEALREEARTTETLHRIGTALAGQLDLQQVVQLVTDEATALTGAQFGAFFYNVLNDRGEAYTLYTLSGVPREAFARFPMPRNTAIFEPTFRGQGVVRLADVTADPRYAQNAPYHGMPEGHLPVRSYLAVPVKSRAGEVLGGLFFGHPEAGVFTDRHERLVVGIAAQAAVAIDNARLYRQARESEARLTAVLDHSPAVVFLKDRDGRYLLVNRRFEELARASGVPGPYLGRTDADLLPAEIAEAFRRDDRRVMEAGQARVYEETAELGGERRTSLTTKFPLADDQGQVYAVGGITLDITDRVRAEAALRDSEERFRWLVEQAPFSVQVFAPDGRTVRVNRAWEELWGVTLDQLADYNVLADPQLDAKGITPYLRRAFAGEPVDIPAIRYDPNETIPDRTRHRDPVRWVAAVAYPLKDPAGRVREVVLVHEDLTARHRAEEGLRASEERLRLALEAGRMGVWDWDVRTNALYWSDSLEPLHGLAPGTFEGTFEAFQRLVHPADRGRVNAAIARSLDERGGYDIEFRAVWPDGTVRWIAGNGHVVTGADGRPARMIGVALDITDRKRAEDDARFLADASATLAALVDYQSTLQKVARLAVPAFADWCAVDMLDEAGRLQRLAVAHVDPAKVELAHDLHRRFPPDPAAPTGVWQILRTGGPELVADITDELIDAGTPDPELRAVLRELGLRSYMGVPLSVRGKVLGAVTFIAAESGRRYGPADLAVAEDLAHRAAVAVENARLYQEVRAADRAKDEFLAMLAHELRNPLAPVRNGLHLLRLDLDRDALARTREMMDRQVTHLVRLVDDLLDVSRIMRGKVDLRREPVDLVAVAHRAAEMAQPAVDAGGHDLSLDLPGRPVRVDGDPVRLAQVLSNLLVNAAKYSDRPGRITVTVETAGREAVVRVADTGVGIAREHLSRIFDLFAQVDRSAARTQGGLGIGLTLVRRLVELHGGTVTAHSDGPGTGSTFTVRLPLLDGVSAREDGSAPPSHSHSHLHSLRRVLVVDDNVDAADSLAHLLRAAGHEVRVAHDGPAGLAAADAFGPEVVLLDIGLPGLDGYEVARRLRGRPGFGGTRLVAMTGYGQPEDRRRSKEAGFDDHLVKPVDPEAVHRLLAELPASGPGGS